MGKVRFRARDMVWIKFPDRNVFPGRNMLIQEHVLLGILFYIEYFALCEALHFIKCCEILLSIRQI